MKRGLRVRSDRKSIFRSLFAPLFILMILQALIFYFAAVYGGIEESLSRNASEVLVERLYSRTYELETQLHNNWTDLDACTDALDRLYADYEAAHGARPLTQDPALQIGFLQNASTLLIDTLRQNEVNGIFLILNDRAQQTDVAATGPEEKYGLCIRDMDQDSNYDGTEDLLLERAPSSLIDSLDCSLDSWWEAKFTFASPAAGDFYYRPLNAAFSYPGVKERDLMYCSDMHRLSGSDPAVVSCSLPLLSDDGYPYGVIGVELSAKYLSSLLPSRELNESDKSCYVLAMQETGSDTCDPLVGSGVLYNRCFEGGDPISLASENKTGGFDVTGRGGVVLYGEAAQLDVYNNNSPFESRWPVLLAFVERDTLFAYVDRVKLTLMIVSVISLLIGVLGIFLESRRFAAPITALAKRVRGMEAKPDFQLDRLGITEIDQLVDAIEELNRNVGRGSARTEFFSRMSHDMRTPMNAIIGFSSPALLENASEAVKDDYLEKIQASGRYLLGLINEVLDMTKIESNKTELHTVPVQAYSLFDTTVPIIEKLAQSKHIAFTVENSIPANAYVEADVQHLNQIVMNLLSNAVKFTPEGGAVILKTDFAPDGAGEGRALCRMIVSDNGIGMSEAFMKNLYKPFEQENSRREGTGLGLSIAQKLVALMGGTIRCECKQHYGTTFTVSVPLPLTDAPASGPAPSRQAARERRAAGSVALRGKRVLVCEDNAINLMIVQNLLTKWGVLVEAAENGKIGVELFASSDKGRFDAILMDVQMPVMDGLAAAKAIRALRRPDAQTIPIIAMTANAFAEDERASQAAGMNAHLAKPVDPDLFFDTLCRYIG